ncbi:MAG TPA: NAD(P)/FAD-dependent oxidoreductase [Stellaceae bacterium]|nr:NAD(P)/FAD-dependent oxidoreductase [Stellaceae bacterium]
MRGTDNALTIAIIGSGFGGIGMAIRLKQAGIHNFTIYTRSHEVGGVWYENTYPGAACDVASSLYSYSFEPRWDWSRTHGTQPEIAAYLKHCVAKYGIAPHIRFGAAIAHADYDEERALWRLGAADGRRFEANVLVSACGLFNEPAYPEIPGLSDFSGACFHSARWDHDYDLTGKRVAVIGTGCSTAQYVPEIVGKVSRLTAFIRTPQYVMPKIERTFDAAERQSYRRFPVRRRFERIKTYVSFERRFAVFVDERARKAAEDAALAFLASQVKDPEKRRLLTPTYRFGCKRTIQSRDYLAALDRDNVEIVRTPIARAVADGLVDAEGRHHALDCVIFGTGFVPSDYLASLSVTGAGGRALKDAWRDGPEAYLGITVAGFPNFFMLYGPNTNTATSIVVMLEGQIGYILKCLKRLRGGSARSMSVRAEVQARFNADVQKTIAATTWGSGCRSYFVNAAGRVVTQWPKPSRVYRWLTRRPRASDFQFTRG